MRKPLIVVAILVFLLGDPGCSAFRSEDVKLSPAQVAQVTAVAAQTAVEAGKDPNDPEALRKIAEQVFQVKVDALQVKLDDMGTKVKELTLKLQPLAQEVGVAGGTAIIETVAKNPGTSAIGGGIIAGAVAAFAAWSRRSRLKREAQQQ